MTSTTTTSGVRSPVTMLGLGPMGQAMTRIWLAAGHPVTVWNRTPGRAREVVTAGAQLAATPAEAIAASGLVIISLTDYQAMWDILAEVSLPLGGRSLVNLSSDTPDATREASRWAQRHGASFLTGGVMVPAPMLGTDPAYVYYSGDPEAFDAHQETLTRIGAPRFLGADPGRAQLMYQAHLDVFLTSLSGIAHATALVGTAGITAESFLPEVLRLFSAIPDMVAPDGMDKLGARIDSHQHPGVGSTVSMMGATAEHIYATAASLGIDHGLPEAVRAHYQRAIADGFGTQGWTQIIEGMRSPR